jgi:hypothetical protein
VVDICRARIWFAGALEASACLSAIAADARVAVVRVKDRTAPSQPSSWDTAGFRV